MYVYLVRMYAWESPATGSHQLMQQFRSGNCFSTCLRCPSPEGVHFGDMCYTKYMYIRIYIYIYMDGKSAMWVCLVWLRHVRLFGTYFNSKLNSIPFDSIRGSRLVVTRLAWQLFWLKTHRHTNTLTVCLPE